MWVLMIKFRSPLLMFVPKHFSRCPAPGPPRWGHLEKVLCLRGYNTGVVGRQRHACLLAGRDLRAVSTEAAAGGIGDPTGKVGLKVGWHPFNVVCRARPSRLPASLPALPREPFTQPARKEQKCRGLGLFWANEALQACALL